MRGLGTDTGKGKQQSFVIITKLADILLLFVTVTNVIDGLDFILLSFYLPNKYSFEILDNIVVAFRKKYL